MAENEQPEQEEHPDPEGKALDDAIRSNEALLAGLKYELGQKMLEAQQGQGEMPLPIDVLHVKKLETQIVNSKLHAEARQLTRKRAGAAE